MTLHNDIESTRPATHVEDPSRGLVDAVCASTATGEPFLIVARRGDHPWLVPDAPVTRQALLAAGIALRRLESFPPGLTQGDTIPDLSRWGRMAVAAHDDDGIGWMVIVMKAGSILRVADHAENRLTVLRCHLPLVEARMSGDAVSRVLLPNG